MMIKYLLTIALCLLSFSYKTEDNKTTNAQLLNTTIPLISSDYTLTRYTDSFNPDIVKYNFRANVNILSITIRVDFYNSAHRVIDTNIKTLTDFRRNWGQILTFNTSTQGVFTYHEVIVTSGYKPSPSTSVSNGSGSGGIVTEGVGASTENISQNTNILFIVGGVIGAVLIIFVAYKAGTYRRK